MGDTLNILLGKINYLDHEVDEQLAPTIKPLEVDHLIKISIELRHIKDEGHEIDVIVNQGFVKKNTNNKVLSVRSVSHFKITPYDSVFFKKPGSEALISLIAQTAQIAADHNRGMFVIIREDHGMNDALPMPIPLAQMKRLVYNDINRQLLN